MDWNDVRFFLALARTGSVRAAGNTLRVSHSTVGRRVEALEAQLATRLFDRSRDGFTLTEAGRQMLATAERVELEMNAVERTLAGSDDRLAGPISLTCFDVYVAELLMEELVPFCDAYPEIELGVIIDSRPFDLSKREADIAVRALGADATPPEHLIGRKVVPMVIASYVAKAHADRLHPERRGSAARWIAFEDRKAMEMMVGNSSYPDLPLWGSMASIEVMALAARAGLGIALLPTYVGDADPTLMRLERADPRHMADLWLLSHPDLRDNARLVAARECVYGALQHKRALFAGELA